MPNAVARMCLVLCTTAVSGEVAARRRMTGKAVGRGKAAGGGNAGKCATDYHNCWSTHRCCNERSRCYTKADGVTFAQCRPNGCVGTCGWECVELKPGITAKAARAAPEYGRGAQNVTQAVAAMKLMPPPPAGGAAPPGKSERLGNVIDSWYFTGLGDIMGSGLSGVALAHLMSMTCSMEPCFARYLATQFDVVSASAAQRAAAMEEARRHSSWGMYNYPTIRTLMPALRHDLRGAMRRYAQAHDPSLLHPQYEGGARHLVVHYRLGDFVTNSWCIPPRDVAAAAAPLSPSVIEIMDGGMRHLDQVDGYSAGPHRANRTRQQYALQLSAELQRDVEAALRSAVPDAKIVRSPAASIDHDWFRIAHAPLLVTGAGSFAVTAAIAAHASEVRTPAADNLNFPDTAVRTEEQLAPNWRTYRYDMSAMRG